MIATDTEILHFLKIYQERNLTRAAFGLKLTQPALTQSLLRLESKLQTNLFIRTKQGCTPTESADILYGRATQLQECWNEIKSTLKDSHEKLQGQFRLGCHPSMAAYLLPDFFKGLYAKAPLIDVQLVHDLSRNLTEKVIQMELDVAFVANPEKHPDLIIHKVANDRVCFWKSSTAKNIPPILFSGVSASDMKKKFKSKAKLVSDFKHVQTSSLELIRTLTNQGAGYGYLPERVARMETSLSHLKEFPSFDDDICLIYRMGTLKSSAAKTLLEVARKKL